MDQDNPKQKQAEAFKTLYSTLKRLALEISAVMLCQGNESMTHGLKQREQQQTMDDLRRQQITPNVEYKDIQNAKCLICLESINTAVMVNPCGHTYHERCFIAWIEQGHVCPMCRIPVNTQNIGL